MTEHRKTLTATLTLIGTIIGVGVFGVPYTFAAAGVAVGTLWFVGLTLIVLVLHLYYAEIVTATKEDHRLVGFAKKYLGSGAAGVAGFATIFSFYGSIVAYIIVGGGFIHNLLHGLGGDLFFYQVVFFALTALLIAFGLKIVGKLESFLTALLMLTMAVVITAAFSAGSSHNFPRLNPLEFFLPYGVIFYALTGSNAIPEMYDMVGRDGKILKKSVILGTLSAAMLTFLFAISVVAVSGVFTSSEALRGLEQFLGSWIMVIGSVFGFLAIATSFLVIGLNLRDQFIFDFKIGKFFAWVLACAPSFLLYLFGTQNFIKIISLTGGILAGFIGATIVFIYLKVTRGKRRPLKYLAPLLIFIFIFGIVYEVKYWAF
jgi:amino acid permease